jgi:hypothetical protein
MATSNQQDWRFLFVIKSFDNFHKTDYTNKNLTIYGYEEKSS